MRAQTKAMGEIRRKREEARRNQTTALHRNLEIDVSRTLKGSGDPILTKVSKPVNLSHFKMKTVLGRGGYGKVKTEKR